MSKLLMFGVRGLKAVMVRAQSQLRDSDSPELRSHLLNAGAPVPLSAIVVPPLPELLLTTTLPLTDSRNRRS